MVASETGKIGIIKRSHESVTPPRLRYSDARRTIRAFVGDPRRDKRVLHAARTTFEQRASDLSQTAFVRSDAEGCKDVIDHFLTMQNVLGGYDFVPAPQRQAKLSLGGVEVSVNVDALLHRTKGATEQIGGALFRFTKAEDESDNAAGKRREMGLYAATLALIQVQRNLKGNREPHHQLCLSVDVQCEEVHVAPKAYTTRIQNLENACRFIAAMWGRV